MTKYLIQQSPIPILNSFDDLLTLLYQLYSPQLYHHFLHPNVFHVTACYRPLYATSLYTIVINEYSPKSEWDFLCLNVARAISDVILSTGRIQRSESNLDITLLGRHDIVQYLQEFRHKLIQQRFHHIKPLPDILLLSRLINSHSLYQMDQLFMTYELNQTTTAITPAIGTNLTHNSTYYNNNNKHTQLLSLLNQQLNNPFTISSLQLLIQYPPQISLQFCLMHIKRKQTTTIFTPSYVYYLISQLFSPLLTTSTHNSLIEAIGPLSIEHTTNLNQWIEFFNHITIFIPSNSNSNEFNPIPKLNDQISSTSTTSTSLSPSTPLIPSTNTTSTTTTSSSQQSLFQLASNFHEDHYEDHYDSVTRASIQYLINNPNYHAISIEAGPVTTHPLYFPLTSIIPATIPTSSITTNTTTIDVPNSTSSSQDKQQQEEHQSHQQQQQQQQYEQPFLPNYLLLSVYTDDPFHPPKLPDLSITSASLVHTPQNFLCFDHFLHTNYITENTNRSALSSTTSIPHSYHKFNSCLISLTTEFLDQYYELQLCPFRPYPIIPYLSQDDINEFNITLTSSSELEIYNCVHDGTIELSSTCSIYAQFTNNNNTNNHNNNHSNSNSNNNTNSCAHQEQQQSQQQQQPNSFIELQLRVKNEILIPFLQSQRNNTNPISAEDIITHITNNQSKLQYFPSHHHTDSSSPIWNQIKFSDIIQKLGWTMYLLKRKDNIK